MKFHCSHCVATMTSTSINTLYTIPANRTIHLPRLSTTRVEEKSTLSYSNIICSATQQSTTTTATEKVAAAAPAKPKPAAKAPAKALPELMEEEVIPSLRETLEAQEDISKIELSFGENRLEGSFLKRDVPYKFWAFFPDGVLTGPKGFSLSSYGSGVSTVEPFLIDEKKITSKHVVFWVVKRLAAQGILPIWKEDLE